MKQLKENEGIERGLLLTMAVIAGLTVANYRTVVTLTTVT